VGAAVISCATRRIDSAGNPTRRGDALRWELARDALHVFDPGDEIGDVAEVDEPVREEHVTDREEERGVGAGHDRDPLVGLVGGAGAAGVDDDDLASTGTNGVDLAEDVGTREQAALRRLRVAAHHEPVVRAADVG
jgi:hypothetical protein